MTKTTKKQLIEEYIIKAQEMKDAAKELQSKTIKEARVDYYKIKLDGKLSPEGKYIENEATRQFYAHEFLKRMDEIKTKYDRYVADAKKLALEITAAPLEYNGTEAKKAAFDKSLRDLKVKVALNPSQDRAVEEIQKFVHAQDNPYFAQQIADNFGDLIAPFANTPSAEIKAGLSKIYETAKRHAITDETRYAQQVLDVEDNAKLILDLPQSQSFQALQSVVGRRAAQNANQPQIELGRIAQGDKDLQSKHAYGEQGTEEEQAE